MSKAEKRALEAYPKETRDISGFVFGYPQYMRDLYSEGYSQAEEDLELSWKDIEKICIIAKEVHQFRGFWSEHVYQEILKRFKEKKNGN
jgi:hypothetical protein